MDDHRVFTIRIRVHSEFALADDNFEAAQILFDSEKYRASIPLFRESLLSGIRALLMIYQDRLPQNSSLFESFHQTGLNKKMKLDISINEILDKLGYVEQEIMDHPLRISTKNSADLGICRKQIEHFLSQADRIIKKSLLTSEEIKKKKATKTASLSVAASVVLILVLIKFISFISTLDNGLHGSYFADVHFKRLVKTKIDRKIDFNWGSGKIVNDNSDNVSIRWTGRIKAPKEGRYTFITRSDDGVRLWIDDKLIINDWEEHLTEIHRATLNLRKGYHRIKIEYFEKKEAANLRLTWILPESNTEKMIPPSKLEPEKNGIRS